jgi:hypothetical protein
MAKLTDGYQTTISFGTSTVSKLYEKTVQPPGMEAGGPIDQTIMANADLRTQMPKSLITVTANSFEAAYDPEAYDEMVASININQLITITFPDGATLKFWGWLDKFTPNEHVEGEMPTASCTIEPSNLLQLTKAETAPDFTAAP